MFSGRFPFKEHIDELRQRLKIVALSFLVILIVVVLFPANPAYMAKNLGEYLNLNFLSHTVIAAFLGQVHAQLVPKNWVLIAANGIGEPMEVYFVASLIVTVALDMPIIAYETYKFVDPALTDKERKMVYPFVTSSTVLFVVGLLFGYFILAKFLIIALQPFFAATGTSPYVDLAAFYYVVFLIIGATGLSFTAPVFVYTLIRLRVVEPDFFSKNRVIIWFLVWVVTGLFLTPDGGPLLDIVIFVPIVGMIEAAVVLARRGLGPAQGKPVDTVGGVVCPSCGKPLATKMLFCSSCGKSVA